MNKPRTVILVSLKMNTLETVCWLGLLTNNSAYLQRKDLTLTEYITECRQAEQIKINVAEQSKSPTSAVEEIAHGRGRGHSAYRGRCSRGRYHQSSRGRGHQVNVQKNEQENCGRCKKSHNKGQCPASAVVCFHCKQRGHFARRCQNSKSNNKSVREVQEDTGTLTEYFLGAVTQENVNNSPPWQVTLKVAGTPVKFKIDCGADVSVMTEKQYNHLKYRPKLCKDYTPLKGVGNKISCLGVFTTSTIYKGRQYTFDVYVVPGADNNLLSRPASRMMELIELKIGEVDQSVFGECGMLKTDPVKIRLKEDVIPCHVNTPRSIPLPLMSSVAQELQRMENADVIEKVTEPTEWCSPLVVVHKKSGAVRLCVDLRKLNKAILRERYIIPTLEDIKTKLAGGCVFSSLDAASGYYQIPLDGNSRKLTTFMTPQGRYCFKRLPFGITSASEIFQRKMTDMLHGLDGCRCISR